MEAVVRPVAVLIMGISPQEGYLLSERRARAGFRAGKRSKTMRL